MTRWSANESVSNVLKVRRDGWVLEWMGELIEG